MNPNRDQRRYQEREERRLKKAEQQAKEAQTGKSAVERAAARKAPTSSTTASVPIYRRLWRFLKEVRAELKRVSWPTREQMVAFTTVTLITTAALTLFTFLLDIGFKQGLTFILEVGT